MDAIVSGHAGVALLLLGGDRVSSLHYELPGELISRRISEVYLLFGGARDLELLENTEVEQVARHLDLAATRIDALHLALILLDGELTQETRCQAAAELEELLRQVEFLDFLENVLFASPIPSSIDLPAVSIFCSPETPLVFDFLQTLDRVQSAVVEVRQAWEAIPSRCFGSEESRILEQATAVREGVFRRLVVRRASGAPVDSEWQEDIENGPQEKTESQKNLLNDWVFALATSAEKFQHGFAPEDLYDVRNEIKAYEEIWSIRTRLPSEPELASVYAEAYHKLRRLQAKEAEELTRQYAKIFPLGKGMELLARVEQELHL